MDEIKYHLTFRGEEADYSRLPAHEGATSLEGMCWTISLISHYAATGKIRSRGELSPKIRVYISPPRQGSYATDIIAFITEPQNLFLSSIVGSYVVATVGQVVNSLIVSSIKEVCGLAASLSKREENWLSKLPSGDREALVDRIEPSMRRAHTVIDEGAAILEIKKGRTPLLSLDSATKSYVNSDISGDNRTIEVSIGAFNANSGNGRLYIPEIGKTVPFFVPKGLDAKTYAALSYSLDRYVNRLGSNIEIDCTEILSIDERIKKLIIEAARKVPAL